MNCARAEELLPWLLNGSLDAAEAGNLRAHLAGCAACRTAWVDTTWVAESSACHVPEATLVDLAAGGALPSADRAAVEAHLAACTACAAELSLLRESWTAHAAERLEPGHTGQELEAPQVNAQVAELMPQELVLRGAPATLPVLSVPAAGRTLLLLYAPPAEAGEGDYGVELRDMRGALIWAAQGLKRTPSGDFSLSLPAALLTEGAAEIRVLAPGDGRAVVARYRFAVRRGSGS